MPKVRKLSEPAEGLRLPKRGLSAYFLFVRDKSDSVKQQVGHNHIGP